MKPLMTEKASLMMERKVYTFLVPVNYTKEKIKKEIFEIFGVNVASLKTLTSKATTRRTLSGKTVTHKKTKKVYFSLKEGQTIEIFETKKKEK